MSNWLPEFKKLFKSFKNRWNLAMIGTLLHNVEWNHMISKIGLPDELLCNWERFATLLYHPGAGPLHVPFLMSNNFLILMMLFCVWGYHVCPRALKSDTSTWDTTNGSQQSLIAWNDIIASCSPIDST